MTETKSILTQIARETASRIIDENDRYDVDEIDQAIADELEGRAEIEAEIRFRAARSARKEVERSRQPKWAVGDEQLSMFDPSAILVLGGGQRVHMEYAEFPDTIAADEVLRLNWQGVNDRYNAWQAYKNERQQEWLKHSEISTLGQLERQVFGYEAA